MKTICYALEDGIATLTFDEPGSPVNTMCEAWQADLTQAVAQVVTDANAFKASCWRRPRPPSSPAPT